MDLSQLPSVDMLAGLQQAGAITPEQAQQITALHAAAAPPAPSSAPAPIGFGAGSPLAIGAGSAAPLSSITSPPPSSPLGFGAGAAQALTAHGISDTPRIADAPASPLSGFDAGSNPNRQEWQPNRRGEPVTPTAPTPGSPAALAAAGGAAPASQLAVPMGGGGGPSAAMKNLYGQSAASSQTVLDANQKQLNAIEAAQSAVSDEAWGKKAQIQNAIDAKDEIQSRRDEHWQRATSQMDTVQAQLDAKMASIKDVDPDKLWNSKSAGSKVLAGIAVALGAFGAGMPHSGLGGRNYALEMINNAQQADLEAQKSNIAKSWQQVSKGHEVAKDNLSRAMYEQDQMDKLALHSNDKLQMQLAQLSAGTQDAEQQAKYAGAAGEVTKNSDAVRQQMFGRMMQQQAASSGGGLGALGVAYQNSVKEYAAQRAKDGNPLSFSEFATMSRGGPVPGGAGGGPGGNPLLAGIPKDLHAKALEEIQKKAESDQAQQHLDEIGARVLDPNLGMLDRSRARDELKATALSYHEKFGAPGRAPEVIEKTLEPGLPTANPFANNADRLRVLKGLLPRPATPILDAFQPRPAAAAPLQLPPGAVPVRR